MKLMTERQIDASHLVNHGKSQYKVLDLGQGHTYRIDKSTLENNNYKGVWSLDRCWNTGRPLWESVAI